MFMCNEHRSILWMNDPLFLVVLQLRACLPLWWAHTTRRRQAKTLEHQGSTHHDQRQVILPQRIRYLVHRM